MISLGDDLIDSTQMTKERFCRSVCSISLASIFRECLKLGKSQSDRLVIKELIKAVCDLATGSWTDDVNMVSSSIGLYPYCQCFLPITVIAIIFSQLYCVGSFAYGIKKTYPLDKITVRTLEQIAKSFKKNSEVDPETPKYHDFRLEFCNQAAGLAELFDSIICSVDIDAISDVEEDTAPKRTTKAKRVTRRHDADSESSDGGDSEEEEEVVQRRPAFVASAAGTATREKISRSSKTLAQDKMTKLADENMEKQEEAIEN